MQIFEQFVKPVVSFLTQPEVLLPVAAASLLLALKYYRTVTQPRVAGPVGLFIAASFVGSLWNENFRKIITKPDNIPIVLLLFSVIFLLWFCLRRAAVNDERAERNEPPLEADFKRETVLVWPDLVFTELICLVLVSALLTAWSVGIRAPLEEPASAALTPNPSKAPWYFLGLQEMLVYFDPWYAGVLLPTLIIVGLMAIPYVDMNPRGNGYFTLKERRFSITVFLVGFLIFWVLLIIIGTFLRGPNWNFFGPYDTWDPHLQRPLKNINISEIIWVKLLKTAMPEHWLHREIFGILAVGAFA
ncbi:MAG: hypothetical protein ACREID_06780, partial [Planctomycetota bacterium]